MGQPLSALIFRITVSLDLSIRFEPCLLDRLIFRTAVSLDLSDRVSLDLSNHYNQLLPCQVGWDISNHNAQVLIYDPEGHAIGLDSVHYEMLAELHGPACAPTELFLRAVLASGMRQCTADLDYYVSDCCIEPRVHTEDLATWEIPTTSFSSIS